MTKHEIVKEIAKSTGLEVITVTNIVESFMETVKDSMTKDKDIFLRGFGTFAIKKRTQKTARNISKNTTVIIPSHNVPTFKPCKEFVNKVKKIKVKP